MVDILLIPGKYNKNIIIPKNVVNELPKNVILFSSVQYAHQSKKIAKQLIDSGINVIMLKSKNYLYEGLISEPGLLLGCNMENFKAKGIVFDAFLYVGDGVFHPKALLIKNEKDIYCYDPKTSRLSILDKRLHKEYVKRLKGNQSKFLMSKNIGVIITTKTGQGNPKRAFDLKKKIISKWPEKKVYIFYADEINFSELEDFNFIDIYINCACPRISNDDAERTEKPIINIDDVEKLL